MLDRTKAKENWQGKRVLVLGMARSGIAVAQLLCRFGAVPLLNDRKTEQELGETLAPLRELPCEWHLGEDAEALLPQCDVLLISPGVPIDSPIVLKAREMNIPVTGELEVASQLCEGTLVALTMITSMVILAVTSNVVLSLGMVGALSIVRFRTAIKEPLDIAFLFWAIAAGIVLSAGMIPLAVFGSVVIGLVMLLFMNRKSKDNPFIAVISCRDYEAEKRAAEYLNKHVKKADIKSKTAQEGNIELNYEIRLLSDDTDFITELSQLEGVNSAVLVSYNGDYMG